MSKFRKSYDSEDSFESNDDYDISRSSRSDRSERSDSDRSDRSLKNKNFISRSDNERSDRSDRSDVLDTTDEEIKIEIDKKRSKRNKPKKEVEEEVKLYIKEFDLNSMPPLSMDDKKNGVKIVVIGKPGCFAPGTKVLMWDGTSKNVEDVKIGDVVMGDDNTPRNVLELFHDFDEMYEIVPIRGTPYTVNRLHDLVLVSKGYGKELPKGETIEISVEEYLKKNISWKNNYHCFRSSGITCWEDELITIDPYFLGVWLGDGTSASLSITNVDEEIINYCKEYAESVGCTFNKLKAKYRYSITKNQTVNVILNELRGFDLLNNKRIPQNYKTSSVETRLELLAGLLDTDGYYDREGNTFDFIQKNERLADDVAFVARSLGFAATKKQCQKSCMYRGEKRVGTYYRLCIYGKDLHRIPTKVLRKQPEKRIKVKDSLTCSFKVKPKGYGEYFGFRLDGNRRFLLDSFEAVRNSGKSTIIQEIIASKAHIIPVGQVFSGTEDSNQFYSSKMPGICVYNKLDMAALKKFVERQHIAKKFLQNPWAVQIIDDCTDNPKQLRDPLIQAYYKNGRHWCMMHILSLQYCLDILPNIRTNIDYTFILRETSLKNRENLWKNYASCVDNLNEFCQIMDQITNDYTALVINNRAMSNKLEDCIFWFKAHPNNIPPTWKFGCQDAWDFHRERLDPNYRETYI